MKNSPIASNPKRPSNYKRSYNFIRKNIKDTSNIESDDIDTSRFSGHIAPTDSIITDDFNNNKGNVPSVYLNKYLKKGIIEESRKIIRDIAPTIDSKYLESKRKLISRECKDGNNAMINDVQTDNFNEERPIKSKNAPTITESQSNNMEIETNTAQSLSYSPPSSPPPATINKFSDIVAIGINTTSPNKNKGENQD